MENFGTTEIIALMAAGAIIAAFGVAFYLRKVKGRSADLKERDEKGKIVK